MAQEIADLTGKRFGNWTVIGLSDKRNNRNIHWWCQCACGIKREIPSSNLTMGLSTSCQRCSSKRAWQARLASGMPLVRALTHGHTAYGKVSPEYRSYANAKQMFTNPKNPSFPIYGGCGVKFLFETFEQFFAEVGERPEPKNMYAIALINSAGNFEPGNVRWVTWREKMLSQKQMRRLIAHAA